jgi:hypothetical protein
MDRLVRGLLSRTMTINTILVLASTGKTGTVGRDPKDFHTDARDVTTTGVWTP